MEEILNSLDPYYRFSLLSMYRNEPQIGTDGQLHSIDRITQISPLEGMWLYNFCLSTKPASTLEIGLAYGYSTLFFLAAIAKNQTGHHTAIDPYQQRDWHGIGLTHVKATGLNSAFRFIEDRSDRASTNLAQTCTCFDLIFIDGNHRFDDVLVDFYLYAPLCKTGGHIIFHDMWMSSVQTVVAFIKENRPDFVTIPCAETNIYIFQKVGDDLRHWDHFCEFPVSVPKPV